MSARLRKFDFLIVGGGLFGVYAALTAQRRGLRVLLVERESELFTKASVVNQARLHQGYHYPRSIATAQASHDHYDRFLSEHRAFVNTGFTHYYAIDRFGSLTDGHQFERFCRTLDIPAQRVHDTPWFKQDRLEAVFQTAEPSFDPFQVKRHYLGLLEQSDVEICLLSEVLTAQPQGETWLVELRTGAQEVQRVEVGAVVNATYANLNAVNRLFDMELLDVVHEQAEVLLLESRALRGIGLTVMDGPFCSVMPYGDSGFHSLTSVLYTHHAVSRAEDPVLACQRERRDCTPPRVRTCSTCAVRPRSNRVKMLAQARHYLKDEVDLGVRGSLMTVKTKLVSSAIDDSRPTEMSLLASTPRFYCLFSGKINSIYEVERVIDSA